MSTLTRYNPTTDLAFVDPFNFFDNWMTPFVPMRSLRNIDRELHGMMRTDVKDNGDTYEVLCDLPGVSKDDINVDFDSDTHMLTISHETHSEKGDGDKDEKKDDAKFLRRERFSSYASSTVSLPDASADGIKASYADGVLTITLNKVEPKDAKTSVTIE